MSNITMKRFHEMEVKYKLFEIGAQDGEPIWDYMRYYVYSYLTNKSVLTVRHSDSHMVFMRNLIFSCFSIFRLFFKSRRVLFLEYPRKMDKEGFYYDQISRQYIESLNEKDKVVISLLGYRKTLFNDINIKALNLFRFIYFNKKKFNIDYYNIISEGINDVFGCSLPFSFIEEIYKNQKFNEFKFDIILRILKPRKVFVSTDLQKPLFGVAKKRKIDTFEIQHAGLVYDYLDYSYPSEININSNISFAKYYLLFGKEWLSVNNIPTQRIVVGNDCFYCNSKEREIKQRYIVIISSRIHSHYLIPLTKQLSNLLPDYKIIYKLHPDECITDECFSTIKSITNVILSTNQYDLQTLISYSEMVVLIYSSICFEALYKNKKVLIWKEGNYDLLSELLLENRLVRCTNNLQDVMDFLKIEDVVETSNEYFNHFDRQLFDKLIA